MGKETGISWTDHTFNPWWGCFKVSDGCKNCYAETLSDKRGYSGMGLPIWGPPSNTPRRLWPHDSKHWQEPLTWQRHAEKDNHRHRVFCASMADVFEDHPSLPAERAKLFKLIAATPLLDWQLLTKRPENVMQMVPVSWYEGFPDNVWIGTSVEDERVHDRITELLRIPAAIRWLSVEPLIGPLTIGLAALSKRHTSAKDSIDWVVVGGESGPNFRAMDFDWARDLRDECEDAGVPFFFKQVGGRTPKSGGDLLDGVEHKAFPRDRTIYVSQP